MKKLIKKSLGLALAFVMLLTLAPMTTLATEAKATVPAKINSPVGDNSYVSGPSYDYVTGPSYEYVTTDEYVFVGVIGDYVAGESEDVVCTNKTLEAFIKEAAEGEKEIKLATTSEIVMMSFDAKELLEAGDFELNLTVATKEDVKDETVAKNAKITKDNFVMKVEFNHSGDLPGTATIAIVIPEAIAEKYEVLYYYQIMEDGTLKYVCDAPVADGIATVKQDHCSDYVLLTEKIAVEAPKTGDNSNIGLWVAVLGLGAVAIAGSAVMKKREF